MRLPRLLAGAFVGLVLLVVAADLVLGQLSYERLRPVIERQLTEALGLEVRLHGELELDLWPLPHFDVRQITVANIANRPSPHLLAVDRLALDFRLWPLLRGKIEIGAIEVVDGELRIEPDEQGRFSFSPDLEELDEQVPDPDSGGTELHVAALYVENLRVFYDRAREEDVTTVVLDVLELRAERLTSPMSATVEGDFEGGTFELEARLGSLVELLDPTEPWPLDLRGRVLETDLELVGTLESPADFTGVDLRFSARIDDLTTLLRDPDLPLPDLGPVHATGRLHDRDGILGVESLRIGTDPDRPVQLVIEGTVRDLMAVEGVDLRVIAEAEDTSFFEAVAGTPLPDRPRIRRRRT